MMLCANKNDVRDILVAHHMDPESRSIPSDTIRLVHTGWMVPRFPWRLTVEPVPSGVDRIQACIELYRKHLPRSSQLDPGFAHEFGAILHGRDKEPSP
jgi:hypothetical protein